MAEIYADDLIEEHVKEPVDTDAQVAAQEAIPTVRQQLDAGEPVKPTPSEHPIFDAVIGYGKSLGPRFMYGLGKAQDAAVTAVDARTMGVGRNLIGLSDVMKAIGGEGGIESVGDIADVYNEGYARADEQFEESRDELPMPIGLGAEIFGAAGGVPKAADMAVAKMTRAFAPNWTSRVGNYATTYIAGIPVAAADRYIRFDEDFDDAVKGGLIDSMLGLGIQAGIGDLIIPGAQKIWRKITGVVGRGQALEDVTSGSAGTGMTLDNLWTATKQFGRNSKKSILDMEVGTQPRWETARRFHNALADTKFPNPDPRNYHSKAQAKSRALYQEAADTVRRYAGYANDEAVNTMNRIMGRGGRTDPRATTREQDAATEQLDSISRSEPKEGQNSIPMGAKIVPGRGTVDRVEQKLVNVFGQPVEEMLKDQGGVWNAFIASMRGDELRSHVRKRGHIGSAGREAERADEILPEDMTVAKMYMVRREMADLLSPDGRINGDPLTSTKRKTVKEIMNVLDDTIAEATGNVSTRARAAFANAMRGGDAEELGYLFYQQRSSTVDSEHLFTNNYRESLDEFFPDLNMDHKERFRKGFRAAMVDRMGTSSPLTELGNYLGDLTSGNVLKEKSQGRDHLELVLGKKAADDLVDMYTNGNHLITFRNNLADLIDAKRERPNDAKAPPLGIDMLPQHVPQDERGQVLVGMSWLRNYVLGKDRAKVDAMMDMIVKKGPELNKFIQIAAEEMAPGGGAQIGSRTAAVASSFEEYDRPEEEAPDTSQYDVFEQIQREMQE